MPPPPATTTSTARAATAFPAAAAPTAAVATPADADGASAGEAGREAELNELVGTRRPPAPPGEHRPDAALTRRSDEEAEVRVFLRPDEEAALARHRHALDYKLSQEELEFLDKEGYLVIKQLFDAHTCDTLVQELFARAKTLNGLDRNDHKTWPLVGPLGFYDIWHSPTYYQLRQDPRLYSIFAQLLRDPYLTVSIDRVCLNPPSVVRNEKGETIAEFPERASAVFPIHNDMNLWYLEEDMYQGGLALADCPTGGFQCIPGFQKLADIRQYRERFERGDFGERQIPGKLDYFVRFADKDLIDARVRQIPMMKGDFVIWSNRLPHSALANKSDSWRIQCYIRYLPSSLHSDYREVVSQAVCTGKKPALFSTGNATDRNNTEWEVGLHKVPKLSWLGSRLMGLEDWTEGDV